MYGPYGLKLLGIDLAENASLVSNWANNLGISYPLLLDLNYAVWNYYGMGYIPHNVLLDTSMIVLYTNYGYDKPVLLSLINQYYSPAYVENISVGRPFVRLNQDTIVVNARLVNGGNHALSVKAIMNSLDNSVLDSTILYDDGNHQDSLAGDLLFGGFIRPVTVESEFMVTVKMIDLDYSVSNTFPDGARFTSIGPLVFDSYLEILRVANRIFYKLSLRNESFNATATEISARVRSDDPNVISIINNIQNYGDILPGQSVQSPANFGFNFTSLPASFNFAMQLEIYSHGILFWRDSSEIYVTLRSENSTLPKNYSLNQNFPNPFNPVTTIEFDLADNGMTTLKIFNTLGEELTTLVSDNLSAGHHRCEWNAAEFPSGIYFYRLETERFQNQKKMILLK